MSVVANSSVGVVAIAGTGLSRRGLKPVEVLASDKPHGSRLRYMAGCHCVECRKANSAYENERQKARRQGDWNGIVSAEKARRHILKLSKIGVGRKAVAAASDISETIIAEIRSGAKKNIRARTERLILAVTKEMASDRALVSAKETWRLIEKLLEEGYTITQLAHRLGYKKPVLQIGKDRITARTADRIKQLYRKLTT